jgi:hypothetical protein
LRAASAASPFSWSSKIFGWRCPWATCSSSLAVEAWYSGGAGTNFTRHRKSSASTSESDVSRTQASVAHVDVPAQSLRAREAEWELGTFATVNEPSNQVTRNHSIGAYAGAPEWCASDKLRDLPVNLKVSRSGASRASTPTLSARFEPKPTANRRLDDPFCQAIDDLLRSSRLFHPRPSQKSCSRPMMHALCGAQPGANRHRSFLISFSRIPRKGQDVVPDTSGSRRFGTLGAIASFIGYNEAPMAGQDLACTNSENCDECPFCVDLR